MREFLIKNINKITTVLVLITFLVSILIGFWIAQKEAFFHPWNDEISYNELKRKENFKEILIDSNGKKLSGWINIRTFEENSPLIIFFLGNGQNSSNFCKYFESKFDYFAGYNTLIVDYPEYGYSEGKLEEDEIFNNALNIYDYAVNLEIVNKDNIVVIGYSIGTGIATYVSSQRDVNGLILIAPYDNALNLYNDNLDIFYGLLEKCRRYKFESDIYAKNVKIDPLVIASKMDEVIKYKHSIRLSEKFPKINKIVTLENIRHSEFFDNVTVLDEINQYLKERY